MTRTGLEKKLCLLVTLLLLGSFQSTAIADEDDEDEEPVELVFSAAERSQLGIAVDNVQSRILTPEVIAPGEVMLNAYRTTHLAPRIDAQVVKRHVGMGDAVKQGTPLVTLSSVDMADAVGDLLVLDREWRRVQKLGREVVSESRHIEAEVNRQQAHAKVIAFGMPREELAQVLVNADASQATGEYTLYAPHNGVVIRDAFVVGEFVEAGRLLMELSDLSTLWIEGRVDPELAKFIQVGDGVRITADDRTWVPGQVTQMSPHLDESTRTRVVRIEVSNNGALTPGQFVDIAVETSDGTSVIAVPNDAIVLVLGSTMVFGLEENEFEPRPVELGMRSQAWTEITAGLDEGDEIAIQGVFQLKSLLLKSQIGDTD